MRRNLSKTGLIAGRSTVEFSDRPARIGMRDLLSVRDKFRRRKQVSATRTGMFQAEADINLDGVVSLLDVGPFIDLLSGP